MSLFENIRNFTNTKRIIEKKNKVVKKVQKGLLLISPRPVALPIGSAIKISLTSSGEKKKKTGETEAGSVQCMVQYPEANHLCHSTQFDL